MIKTLKIQLKPNRKQRSKLQAFAGTARFAYNWALARQQENYKNGGKFLSDNLLRKEFTQLKQTEAFKWLYGVSNNVTKQAIKDCCEAYKRFFKGLAEHPKFKKKQRNAPSFYQDTEKIQFIGTHVKFEGFAGSQKRNKQHLNWVRLAEKNRIPFGATIKYTNPRITFDGLHWWISVGIESEVNYANVARTEGIGVDVGITNLAVTSYGKVFSNINKSVQVRKLEKRKRMLQRKVSRKYQANKSGERFVKTRNIRKAEKGLLKVSRRLTNIRNNHLHHVTSELVNRKPMFIVLEDLNVAGMLKNKHLAKAVQQQGFYEFRRQVDYKAKWNDVELILADRWFPSSKLCHACDTVKQDLKLSDRTFICSCGQVIDRDYQASLNLRAYGERAII